MDFISFTNGNNALLALFDWAPGVQYVWVDSTEILKLWLEVLAWFGARTEWGAGKNPAHCSDLSQAGVTI